ncbi:hypothetical protein C8J57DRAFT_1258783 [Mycena rebaudengoi]|nr:hypothetical protein C8J57DRAFT_1258783 [Mycena rebaudengoi]
MVCWPASWLVSWRYGAIHLARSTCTILVAALISLPRDQFTFYDGLFTLIAVHSPIWWIIIFRALSDRERKGINWTFFWSCVVLLLWLSLDLVLWISGRDMPGADCDSLNFKDYAAWVLLPLSIPGATWLSVDIVSFASSILLFLLLWRLHHIRYTQLAEANTPRAPDTEPRPSGNDPQPPEEILFIFPSWLDNDLPWPLLVLIIPEYWAWSRQLLIWSVEPGYSFTYGQLLSVLSITPGDFSVYRLVKEAEKGAYLRIATAVASDWVFLLFGYDYADRMNRKCLGDRLAIPRRKLDNYGRTKPAEDAPDPGAQTTRYDRDPTPAGI